jgi:hypothetical protein
MAAGIILGVIAVAALCVLYVIWREAASEPDDVRFDVE